MKRKNRDIPGRRIAQAIIAEYKPQSVAEMQSALKEVFGPMFEAMLNGEMESYLGYEPNSREEKETTNRRNGYFDKTIKTSMGEDGEREGRTRTEDGEDGERERRTDGRRACEIFSVNRKSNGVK